MLKFNFKGTKEECLDHLRGRLEREPQKWGKVFEAFPMIDNRTVKRWIEGEFFPKGQNLIYTMFCLDGLGYQVEEIVALPKELYFLGKETYLKGMTTEDLVELLGPDFSSRNIYPYFLKGVNPSREKMRRIKEILEEISDEKGELKKDDNDSRQFAMEKDEIIECFIHAMKMAAPFAEALMSERFSADDRRKVQEAFGRNDFFRLSLLMDGLSSEESRKQLLKDFTLKK